MTKLIYNGTTYDLSAEAVADLVARGVIKRDESSGSDFVLAPEHLIEEVDSVASIIERPDAPEPPRIEVPKLPGGAGCRDRPAYPTP
jgi:hypothetical protein